MHCRKQITITKHKYRQNSIKTQKSKSYQHENQRKGVNEEKTTRKSKKNVWKEIKKQNNTNENQIKSINEVEEQKENLKDVKSRKAKEKAWARRRWIRKLMKKW